MARLKATPDTSSWQALLGLDRPRAGEEAIVRGLLERVCDRRGWTGAGLYIETGEAEHAVTVGQGDFPAAAARAGGDLRTLALPEAALLYRPDPTRHQAPGEADLLALAAAVHAWRLSRELRRERFAVNYRGVGLEALYDVGLAIASTLDFEQLCEEILLRAVSLLDARRGALYLLSDDRYRLGQMLGGPAAATVACDDVEVRGLLEGRQEGGGELLPGASHLLAVPIEVDAKPRGLLVVGDKESRSGVGPFPDTDERSLSLFANQAAIALENARLHREALEKERLERDLTLAADIQRQLLPTAFPEVGGFEVTGWSRPARHVGGDYYNLLARPDGRLAAVVADVSGKGMPAALMVSTAHSALNLLLDRADVGPDLVERLNRHILDTTAPNKFITLLLAEVDPASGDIHYVNAGHNPALLVRAAGAVEELKAGGMPLGLFSGLYHDAHVSLESGDLLCLYSDGITECEDPVGQEFGPERLADLLRRGGDRSLPELVRAVDGATLSFAQGGVQADDQTLVLLRRTAE